MDPRSKTGGDFCRAMCRSKSRDCITLFCSWLLVCRMRSKPGSSHSSHHSKMLFPNPGHEATSISVGNGPSDAWCLLSLPTSYVGFWVANKG